MPSLYWLTEKYTADIDRTQSRDQNCLNLTVGNNESPDLGVFAHRQEEPLKVAQ